MILRLLFLFIVLHPFRLEAQWRIDFNDGDLQKDTSWQGDLGFWLTENGRLRSNGPAVSGTCISLLREITAPSDFELRFWANPMLATSSNNFLEIILDQGPQSNALVVKLGGTPDEVSVFHRRNSQDSLLIDGEDKRIASSSSNPIAVRLRMEYPILSLEVGLNGDTTDWVLEGSCNLGPFSPKRVHIRACYSSANAQKFFLDALYIGPHEVDTIDYSNSYQPKFRELQITELMADPTPSVGLPEIEWLELYNTTEHTLLLKDFALSDLSSKHFLPQYPMAPYSYLIITANGNCSQLKNFGPCLEVGISQTFLNNAGDLLVIQNQLGDTIEKVNYTDKWYGSSAKAQGGYSLEKRDLYTPCVKDEQNFRASNAALGGTPGNINSLNEIILDTIAPNILNFILLDSQLLSLRFNEELFDSSAALIFNADTLGLIKKSPTEYHVRFNEPLNDDALTLHQAILINLVDCSGNKGENKISFRYSLPTIPEPHQLLVTEVLFLSVANHQPQFIEVYNRSHKSLRLTGSTLRVKDKDISLGSRVLFPGESMILCRAVDTPSFRGCLYHVSNSIPVLDKKNGLIQLHNDHGKLIDFAYYSDTLFSIEQLNEGAYSLERTDRTRNCGHPLDWRPSLQKGGSPGKQLFHPVNVQSMPRIQSILPVSKRRFLVRFSSPVSANIPQVDIRSAPGTLYSWEHSGDDFRNWILEWDEELAENTRYTLVINELKGCSGEEANEQQLDFMLPGEGGKILINEILFDPIGDEPDFVELYNAGHGAINLKGIELGRLNIDGLIDQRASIAPDGYLLMPGFYAVITTKTHQLAKRYKEYREERVLLVSTMPSYSNTSGAAVLLDSNGRVIDSFRYASSMHNKILDRLDGVSLERIDPGLPTNMTSNWTSASVTENFATPGRQNSQHRTKSTEKENKWQLYSASFSPDGDGFEDLALLHYEKITPGSTASIGVYSIGGAKIFDWANNQLLGTQGTLQWEGMDNLGHAIADGPYVVLIQVTEQSGQNSTERLILVKASNGLN